jgi:hypothetical protein
MSLCSKDIDYQKVSTFFWTPLYIHTRFPCACSRAKLNWICMLCCLRYFAVEWMGSLSSLPATARLLLHGWFWLLLTCFLTLTVTLVIYLMGLPLRWNCLFLLHNRRPPGLSFSRYSKVFPCLNNYAPWHEDAWRSGGIASSLLTLALDGDDWSALPPGKEHPVSIGQEAGWDPEPFWML